MQVEIQVEPPKYAVAEEKVTFALLLPHVMACHTSPCLREDPCNQEMLQWMLWEPYKVTYTSYYLQALYEHAVELIRKVLAYVHHQVFLFSPLSWYVSSP
jgi:hypothetical protein